MIPDNKDFYDFFKSLSPIDPKNKQYEKAEASVIPRGETDDEEIKQVAFQDKIQLWYKPGDKIGLKTVLTKLTKEIQKKGHVANVQICLAILSIFALMA